MFSTWNNIFSFSTKDCAVARMFYFMDQILVLVSSSFYS